MAQTYVQPQPYKLTLQNSEPSKRSTKSFGSALALTRAKMALKVDLSEAQLKFSETQCVPLSCTNMIYQQQQPQYQLKQLKLFDEYAPDTNIDRDSFGLSMMKGNFRKTQEDRFYYQEALLNERKNALFAVFDGHQGYRASDYCSKHIEEQISQLSIEELNSCQSLKKVFETLDSKFLAVANENNLNDGTTCTMALILDGKLSIANLGDSTALLLRNNEVVELTNEQVPSRIDEYSRIIQNQGRIEMVGQTFRIEQVLAVSRSIGDKDYKQWVISQPEVLNIEISYLDSLLILATDGIFKIFTKQELAENVMSLRQSGHSFGQVSQILTQRAVEMGCTDNVTLVVVDLSHYFKLSKNLNQNIKCAQSLNEEQNPQQIPLNFNSFKQDFSTFAKCDNQNDKDNIFDTEESSTENSEVLDQQLFLETDRILSDNEFNLSDIKGFSLTGKTNDNYQKPTLFSILNNCDSYQRMSGKFEQVEETIDEEMNMEEC